MVVGLAGCPQGLQEPHINLHWAGLPLEPPATSRSGFTALDLAPCPGVKFLRL
jgi:hypothetical protein